MQVLVQLSDTFTEILFVANLKQVCCLNGGIKCNSMKLVFSSYNAKLDGVLHPVFHFKEKKIEKQGLLTEKLDENQKSFGNLLSEFPH